MQKLPRSPVSRRLPLIRSLGSILFLTGPRIAIRRNLELLQPVTPPMPRIAVRLPRLAALLHPRRAARPML